MVSNKLLILLLGLYLADGSESWLINAGTLLEEETKTKKRRML